MRAVKWAWIVLALGCSDPKATPAGVAGQVEALSRDPCVAAAVTDAQRDRLKADALAGRLTRDDVDRYVHEVRLRADLARRNGTPTDQFCPVQLDVWRHHFGP